MKNPKLTSISSSQPPLLRNTAKKITPAAVRRGWLAKLGSWKTTNSSKTKKTKQREKWVPISIWKGFRRKDSLFAFHSSDCIFIKFTNTLFYFYSWTACLASSPKHSLMVVGIRANRHSLNHFCFFSVFTIC